MTHADLDKILDSNDRAMIAATCRLLLDALIEVEHALMIATEPKP
jgi:hypothetical protein